MITFRQPFLPVALLRVGAAVCCMMSISTSVAAQDAKTPATSVDTRLESSWHVGRRVQHPWTFGAWYGAAFEKRNASKNQRIDGEFRMMALWASRTLFESSKVSFAAMAEVIPMLRVESQAPPERWIAAGNAKEDSELLSELVPRRSVGIGLAPLGASMDYALVPRLHAQVNFTAGGALFSHIVPYGHATHANFTVAPALALNWIASQHARISTGYKLHHLSNASFGGENPGLNSHLWYFSVGSAR